MVPNRRHCKLPVAMRLRTVLALHAQRRARSVTR
jgi:hypothetical protein